MMFRSFYSVFYLYEGESDVLIARAERSTFLNSELKWLAAVKGEDCDDSDAHNNCRVLAVDEYKMQWRFLVCGGYPWNFAWVDMPSNPVARMAIQASARSLPPVCLRARASQAKSHPRTLQIASIEKDYILHHHKGSACHGFYWTGLILLFLLGVGAFFLFCDLACKRRSSGAGEERPLLSTPAQNFLLETALLSI